MSKEIITELEVLFTANTQQVDKAAKGVHDQAQKIERSPVEQKVEGDAKGALAAMDRVEAEAKKIVSAKTMATVEANIKQARDVAAELFRAGHMPFCPHTMTAHFEAHFPDIPDSVYLRSGLEWLTQCEAVVFLPGWEDSEGSQVEKTYATYLGLPCYIYPNLPEGQA